MHRRPARSHMVGGSSSRASPNSRHRRRSARSRVQGCLVQSHALVPDPRQFPDSRAARAGLVEVSGATHSRETRLAAVRAAGRGVLRARGIPGVPISPPGD
jgi:hypothetical protein